ncbi:DUF3392 family protein [Pseudomonas aeruginosa]|uniref:DUF3392 family protein n=1 Tax=Pseudomonas aeruginosa TaxID=287 RepID=UPI00053D0C6D|nr:DUF3392 family protein [Pseudomonas aeruginosa]
MDYALDLIATLSRWSRSHLSDISLAIMATLLVLFLAMVFVTPWLAKGLGYFNNYTLAPVLLLVFFVIGMIADRS